jgi:hypothetical protein
MKVSHFFVFKINRFDIERFFLCGRAFQVIECETDKKSYKEGSGEGGHHFPSVGPAENSKMRYIEPSPFEEAAKRGIRSLGYEY